MFLSYKQFDPEGFESYGEVQTWLQAVLGAVFLGEASPKKATIKVNYHVVHNLVRYKLRAKLKAARPKSSEQDPKAVETFKKTARAIAIASSEDNQIHSEVSQYAVLVRSRRRSASGQDETGLGLKTIEHRKLTAFGVKPVGLAQWQRRSYYLYRVAEPKTGETFFYQFSYLDTDCFAEFLKLFSLFLSSRFTYPTTR